MRIVYICNEYPPGLYGGIGSFTRTIAHGMKESGHDVIVAGYGSDPGERDDGGVRVVILPESRLPRVGWWISRRRLLKWLIAEDRRNPVDIIEVPDYLGLLPFKISRPEVVVRLHHAGTTQAMHLGRRKTMALWWSERTTLARHRLWMADSRHALRLTQDVFRLKPENVQVIYLPVRQQAPDPEPLPDECNCRYVLFAGTLTRHKGIYTLAEAANLFLKDHDDVHLIYAGRVAQERGIAANRKIYDIIDKRIADRVHCPGRVSDSALSALMRRSEVFAFPSLLEAFGLVVAEAMGYNRAVVAANAGPMPELIDDQKTGILFEPGSVNDLAEKIGYLLDNPGYAAEIGSAAGESAKKRFSLQTCVCETERFYKMATRKGRGA